MAQERAGIAPSTLPQKGWQPDYGWVVIFYTKVDIRTRNYGPGFTREMVQKETRQALRESTAYTHAWIRQKNGRRST